MKKVTKATIAAVAAETGHLNLTNYSYINHLLTNGGVIACSIDDPNDQQAAGIYCISQQLPEATREQAGS